MSASGIGPQGRGDGQGLASGVQQGLTRLLTGLQSSQTAVLWTFALTLFLSATLLFSVQPMFTKMVLPKLGGSPSVWAIAMCFFQAILLAGYLYAHTLNKYFAPAQAAAIHVAVCAFAFLALPITIPEAWSTPPTDNAYGYVIGVFAVSVGLPFFAVSANAPLLQSWFARSDHPQAADPYFLYGASNLGSIASLLAYPFVIEPMIGLSAQASVWTWGFVALATMLVGSVAILNREAREPSPVPLRIREKLNAAAHPVSRADIARWVALAFVPSGLLVAFSTRLTTDIASAPFLWVIPLALFLLTFVLVFRDRPAIPMRWLLVGQLGFFLAEMYAHTVYDIGSFALSTFIGFGAFLTTTLVCHRVLYERRPAARRLTDFYLWMSFGGVLGGVFASLVAPQLFVTIYEYPLLLVLGLACRPGLWTADNLAFDRTWLNNLRNLSTWEQLAGNELARVVAAVAAAVLTYAVLGALAEWTANPKLLSLRLASCLCVGFAFLWATPWPMRQFGCAIVLAAGIALLPSHAHQSEAERSFFGIHRVGLTKDGQFRILNHGTTIHGAQRVANADGSPATDLVPATYYHPQSPMARAIAEAQAIRADAGQPESGRFAVIGLGAGSLACYARPSETWRFFEIDPVVARIARDPNNFGFLSTCRPEADIVIGDARLTVQDEAAASLDLLIVDAFSSDAIPVHLLTTEAFRLYVDRLATDGVLAIHISNRYLDLEPAMTAMADVFAGEGVRTFLANSVVEKKSLDATSSQVVLLSKSDATAARVAAWSDVKELKGATTRAWTDDYSNILGALMSYLRR